MMEAAPVSPKPTRRHPVADNPLRLLNAEIGLDWALGDLRRRAATFAKPGRGANDLGAAGGTAAPRLGCEPRQDLCPRLRVAADYLAAAKALDDGLALAAAIAFFPDHWTEPRLPIGQANLLLLRAEGLPPGDPGRLEAIGQALLAWDGRQGVEGLEDAVDDVTREAASGALKTSPPTLAALRGHMDATFRRLVEEVLAEIGVDEGPPAHLHAALWLLNTLEQMRALPIPASAIAAAEERLAGRLVQPVREFFRALDASELGEMAPPVPAKSAKTRPANLKPLSEASVDELLRRFREVHEAAALAAARPTLAQRLADAQALSGFEARRLLAGWQVGAISGRWLVAAELIDGIHAKTLESFPDPETRQTLRVALRVVPSLAAVEATGGLDSEVVGNATAVLGGLKGDYAGCLAFIERLETALQRLGRGEGEMPLVVVTTPTAPEGGEIRSAVRAAQHLGTRWWATTAWRRRPFRGRGEQRRPGGLPRRPPRDFSALRTAALAGLLIVGSLGYLLWSLSTPRVIPSLEERWDPTPASAVALSLPPPSSRPADPTLFTDGRGKTYRVPPGATATLQVAESIIERRRREVQEMVTGLEALRQRIERERPGRGGFSPGGGDPDTAQARFEAKLRGYQREKELVREQERRLQGMMDAHRGQLEQFPIAGTRGS